MIKVPDIIVQGLCESDYEEEIIAAIEEAITKAAVEIPELELTPNDISFFFPRDPSITSDEIPIIIKVQLLFDKPKRTPAIRQLFAEKIEENFSKTIKRWRKLTKIEVALDPPFKPQEYGFCSKMYDK